MKGKLNMPVTLPFTFTPDTVADATQVNANFRAVADPVGQSFTGPTGVGVTPPANAAPGLFASFIELGFQSVAGGAAIGRFGANCYIDNTGVWRYLAAGPALSFVTRPNGQDWEFRWVGPGAAGAAIGNPGTGAGSWITTIVMGPSLTLCLEMAADGNALCRFGFNAYLDPTDMWHYEDNGPAWSIVGRPSNAALEFRTVPTGVAGANINYPGTSGNQWINAFALAAPTANNTTAMTLQYIDSAGVAHYQPVMLGTALTAAAAGMPIGARPLYVVP
jgi:hypothetical protein